MPRTATKRPGKRALRALAEARRAELSARLADLLRALGLGASAAPELVALGRAGHTEELRAGLARHSGQLAGDQRRRSEAEALVLELASLPEP